MKYNFDETLASINKIINTSKYDAKIMRNCRILFIFVTTCISLFFVALASNSTFGIHTTAGGKYWYGVCTNPFVDAVISDNPLTGLLQGLLGK